MERLFIALKIPKNIREKIITFRNEALPDFEKFKWEPEEKIHLTLKFIGEIKRELTDRIAEEIKFVEQFNSLNCKLTKFGFFFSSNKPKVLWVGLTLDDYIIDIVKRLNEQLEVFSIQSEKRKFQAHLTLRRMKGNEDKEFIKNFVDYKIPEVGFKAGEIALIKSDLLPSGSKYTEIKNYKLQ